MRKFRAPVYTLLFIMLLIPGLGFDDAGAQQGINSMGGWENYTGNDNNSSRHLITLNLTPNQINQRRDAEANRSSVFVFISDGSQNDYLFRTLCDRFCGEFAVLEYVTSRYYPKSREQHNKERLRNYLGGNSRISAWPPFFWEPKELQREMARSGYTGKTLMLTGRQSDFIVHSNILFDYKRVIVISHNSSLLDKDRDSFSEKEVLWVGAGGESVKIKRFQEKFGGSVLHYPYNPPGNNLILTNVLVLDDILIWLKSRI